jgi:hypothetical protein
MMREMEGNVELNTAKDGDNALMMTPLLLLLFFVIVVLSSN